jgi:hypothetical protein
MRLEYSIEIDQIDTPRFAVEAVEGIGKLFTLATAVLNMLEAKQKVEVVFHGLNPEDPERKIRSFKEIVASSSAGASVECTEGTSGRVASSSSSFQWLTVTKA